MKSYQEIYDFVKSNYKHDRFEGRNTKEWHFDYSHNIVKDSINHLEKYGVAHISRHESVTGKGLMFDAELNIIDTNSIREQLNTFKKDMAAKGYHLSNKQLNIFKEILLEARQHNISSANEMDNFIKQGLLIRCEPSDIYFSGKEGEEYIKNQVIQLIEGSIADKII